MTSGSEVEVVRHLKKPSQEATTLSEGSSCTSLKQQEAICSNEEVASQQNVLLSPNNFSSNKHSEEQGEESLPIFCLRRFPTSPEPQNTFSCDAATESPQHDLSLDFPSRSWGDRAIQAVYKAQKPLSPYTRLSQNERTAAWRTTNKTPDRAPITSTTERISPPEPPTPTPIKELRKTYEEVDKHELATEYRRPAGLDANIHNLKHHRICEVGHLITQARELENHECPKDPNGHFTFIEEERSGLKSTFLYQCEKCTEVRAIETTSYNSAKVNSAAVTAMYSVGKGHDHLEEILANFNVPCPSYKTYRRYEEDVGDAWIDSLVEEMAENNRREREIAISKGHVDADGTPYITVAADGSWSHRSYGHRYTAKSGTAIIVGKETKGLLFLGIRNKYCYICAVAERAKRAWPQHTCFKNWNKSSPAMEADIIVQGFLESEELHGIRYKKLIGDGDSSVLKQLVERCPYGRQIIKVECVNHLLKNRTKDLYELQAKWSKSKEKVPGEDNRNYEKEFLKDNRIKQIGKTVRSVVEDLSESTEDADSISAIIRNLGAHCTGDHTKCRMEYCPKSGQRQNTYNLSTAFLFELSDIIGRLTEHTSSIMEYQTTNLCESLMSLISKYTGAKQVFYGRRSSYTYRVHGAGLNFNNGQHWRTKMHRFRYKESPPSLLKRMDNKRAKRASGNAQRKRALKVQRRLFGSDSSASESDSETSLADPISDPDEPSSSPNPSAYYGKTCQKPDLPQASLQEKMEQRLALLKVDLERRDIIESLTRDQDIRGRWGQEKLYRATASDFGRICLRRIGFDGDLVEQLVYRAPFNSVQVQWGKDHESEACGAFTSATGLQTKRCGIFIDIERPYLGASPDRVVVGEDAILEVKCPYSARDMTVEEGVTKKKIPYLYKDPVSQQLKLKAKCPYMHQVQGQLAITGRKFCYFVVWTLKDCHIEKILYDEQMWKEMLPKLDNFYLKHMLVEFADPRKYRQMPLRHSKKEAGVQRSKKSSKRSRSDQTTNRKKRKEEIMPESLQKEVKEASPPRDPPHVTPPDVIVDNTTSLSPPKIKNVELRNGHLMPPVKTENRVIALSKTCAFDSFTTIIAEALRENKEYRNAAISYKENPLIDFCFMVAEQEDKNKIYEKRADILVQANIARISKVGDHMTGDCSVNISSVAEILRSAPSAARVDICMDTQCKRKRESSHAYLEPPLVLMSHLQQGAVQIIMKKMSVQIDELCKGCKKSPRLTYYKAKIHLIILTDSYNDGSLLTMHPDFSGQFEIGKLDTHILFDNKRYVLSGVVVWRGTINQHNESDHYYAYIRLQTGEWELHDDLALTVQKNPSTGIPVKPHLIVYTISDEVTPAAV